MSKEQQYFSDGSPIFPRRESQELSESKFIGLLACPFCGVKPKWREWPGRDLQMLEHECRHVNYEGVCSPENAQREIEIWNTRAR